MGGCKTPSHGASELAHQQLNQGLTYVLDALDHRAGGVQGMFVQHLAVGLRIVRARGSTTGGLVGRARSRRCGGTACPSTLPSGCTFLGPRGSAFGGLVSRARSRRCGGMRSRRAPCCRAGNVALMWHNKGMLGAQQLPPHQQQRSRHKGCGRRLPSPTLLPAAQRWAPPFGCGTRWRLLAWASWPRGPAHMRAHVK